MTYKTRQEVLRAAADWMDVCEKAGVEANCKWGGVIGYIKTRNFTAKPEEYEFPLALLEGREVWVGSELYDESGRKYVVSKDMFAAWGRKSTWNQPKPATVMVELPLDTAEWYANNKYAEIYQPYFVSEACKKALENLK